NEEARYAQEAATDETPEKLFERRWALTLLDRAMNRLRDEAAAADKQHQYERLSPFLSREAEAGDYASAAAALGMTSGAVGVAVHRLRLGYREMVREEIARTVFSPSQIDEELHHLFEMLR